MAPAPEIFTRPGGSTLLFLPLAHVLARVIQVGCIEDGIILGHSPDVTNLLPDLGSFKPTFLLAVPRVFEKVYNGAEQKAESEGKGAIFRGRRARPSPTARRWTAGREVTAAPARACEPPTHFSIPASSTPNGAAVGGQVQYAVSGGSALGEPLVHFFRGAGITILEGYGLTETTAAATVTGRAATRSAPSGCPSPVTR